MRDLYKRLGITPQASDSDIATAIEACEHTALKADARTVLSVKSRREEYDALHATLCDIGLLRARLGLTHGRYWQDSVANDFSLPPDNTCSQHDELIGRVTHAVTLHNRWQRWRGPWSMAGLLAVGIMLGIALCHLLLR
ncbi:hypothetical protein L861_10205 [Litchfieldella anticariensis FP35 = DSM 16096]|uniref:Uncharacterized protein n=1 Tax=Litchfieldella anticariensis (strain DSM 16096 / CECT 5854 / CIP 108499 / LMG 22089 / FP35) TaxID=1121939 RepID=S2KQE8_LITA3|nr:hypothetical protein [Halomonas anticariensis]EPC02708.1 hypothetical protein L861_10205 [Halomonas anticariensis FP35 = DSM 16096]